ncbi:FxSxx-COOH system tetratricopeptide repeat protein [Streptomyces sp. NPDC014733]|uniref:FxSxx-COOH system tetratricopeptide repeat protein n=1 Tax=Streptomyces sp. NPDC014733 TaxID=3364885 RepID=UPI0036F7FA52
MHVHHFAAPRTAVAWPHQVGVIPSRALSFQHRAEADQLRAMVEGGGTAVLSQVLSGTGGVGKTQLAADYARSAWENGTVDVLVWVTAGSRQAIMAGYAQAGVELLAADPGTPEQAAQAFLAWLEPKGGRRRCRWLVVLDDLADPADLRGLWPPDRHGRTLVTTRRREAAVSGEGRRLVRVGMFTPQEAATYLATALAAHGRHDPAEETAALAADLGYLPLALAQAAAYLIDTALSCADYRRLLGDRVRRLADLLPEPGALPDGQATPVAATWSLSTERADQLRPVGLARPMLQLAAVLDPNGTPGTVLTSTPALTYLSAHRSGQAPAPVTVEDAVGALRALHRLSLIDHTPDDPHSTVRVHQLIQRAACDDLVPAQRDALARTAADALTAAWPVVERDTELTQALRANTDTLSRHAADALYRSRIHPVLYRAGTSVGESGQVAAAYEHFQHLAAEATRRLGPDHLDTLSCRAHIAHWQGEAGNVAGAAGAVAELLDDMLRVLGPDHPHTLATRSGAAHWRGKTGDAAGAAAAFAELLDDRERVLGRDHPHTLMTRNGVARWRGEAGDVAGAGRASAELLDDAVRVLGPDHPHTRAIRMDVARWRGEAGDVAEAGTASAEWLDDALRVWGPDHPNTLTARANDAHWQGKAGDAAEAAAALAALLDDMLRVLGPDHPETLNTRAGLAHWRGEAGDVTGAYRALAELLDDMLAVLGPDHPDTLHTQSSAARWRGEAGDAAGAAAAFAELLHDRERVSGPDHPHTLATREELAHWRGRAESGDQTAGTPAEGCCADGLYRPR